MRNILNKAGAFALAGTLTFGVSVALVSVPRPAHAIPVVCTNCSTIFNQILEYAQAVETQINTAEQLATQIQQYEDMLKQGLPLGDSRFGRITADIMRLQSVYQQGLALAGRLANFDDQFRDQFGDYNDYLEEVGESPEYMEENYEQWSEQGLDQMRVSMKAAGMNVSAIAKEDQMLAQLVQRSASAEGRLQAIQAGNEIAAQQVQQLQMLREMSYAQIQAQSTWYAQNIERQSIDDAFTAQYRNGAPQNSAAGSF